MSDSGKAGHILTPAWDHSPDAKPVTLFRIELKGLMYLWRRHKKKRLRLHGAACTCRGTPAAFRLHTPSVQGRRWWLGAGG